MRRLLALGLLAACSDPPTGEITARVTHYDFKLDVESRVAHADLTLVLDLGGDCLKLPFRGANPTNVTLGGGAANAVYDGTTLDVCGTGWEMGETIHLVTDLEIPLATIGSSQVGYSITKDNEGNQLYYLVSWFGGCDQFSPCDDRPDQFATYKFTVTHPANYKARCPGTITEASPTETICNFDQAGGPTYSTFGVAAYPAWTQSDKGNWGGVQVTLYDRASTNINANIDPAYHGGFLDWMQQQFGPYPYGSDLRILTAPTYWSGFEHPGNIMLDDGLAKTSSRYWNQTAHVLDHEIAHMWAGDQTTLATTYDFVWKEAMAEYLTYVWEDKTSPANALKTAQYWKLASDGATYYPVPGEQPALFDYYGDVYGPGPMVLFHQIEVMTSREQVLAAIKTLLGRAHAISVDDVIAALETSTGLDLDAYAAAWIKGTGMPNWPRYAMTYASGTLTLTQTNKSAAPERGCKFHVALKGANATDVQLVEVDTRTNVDQTIAVTPTFAVTALELDPLAECLVFKQSSSPRAIASDRTHPWASQR